MCQYGSYAITHNFTGSDIIIKPKVYVVLQYYVKKVAEMYMWSSWKITEVKSSEKQMHLCYKDVLKPLPVYHNPGEESLKEPLDGKLSVIIRYKPATS